MNPRKVLVIAALFAALAVILGALGAHGLQRKVEDGMLTPDALENFKTATEYHFFHALAIMIIALIPKEIMPTNKIPVILFSSGILLFSGSIYLLATYPVLGIAKPSFLGPVTPVGGLLFIAGWITIIITSLRKNK